MAKLKPYRCTNEQCSTDPAGRLIFDFWAFAPICPKCGIDGRKMSDVVIQLAIVHFDPPLLNLKRRGHRTMACTGKYYGGGESVTGNPAAVNCPECRATEVWKRIAEERGVEELTDEALAEANAALEAGQAELAEVMGG